MSLKLGIIEDLFGADEMFGIVRALNCCSCDFHRLCAKHELEMIINTNYKIRLKIDRSKQILQSPYRKE